MPSGGRCASWENRQVAGATVHSMYKDVRSRLGVGDGYSKDIGVRVGIVSSRCSSGLCS